MVFSYLSHTLIDLAHKSASCHRKTMTTIWASDVHCCCKRNLVHATEHKVPLGNHSLSVAHKHIIKANDLCSMLGGHLVVSDESL